MATKQLLVCDHCDLTVEGDNWGMGVIAPHAGLRHRKRDNGAGWSKIEGTGYKDGPSQADNIRAAFVAAKVSKNVIEDQVNAYRKMAGDAESFDEPQRSPVRWSVDLCPTCTADLPNIAAEVIQRAIAATPDFGGVLEMPMAGGSLPNIDFDLPDFGLDDE